MSPVALCLTMLVMLIAGYLFITDHERPLLGEPRWPGAAGGGLWCAPAGSADPAQCIGLLEDLRARGFLTEAEYGEWRQIFLDIM